ncbi:MAG: hypothetical protein ABR538_05005 [Candidatus Binatia bacterium]
MQRIVVAGISAVFLVVAGASGAFAHEVTTKKLQVKEHPDPAKRKIQVFSKDPTVLYGDADDPATNGASIHVYSATDRECLQLPAGPEWTDNGKLWKYTNKVTKNQVQLANGKLQVKIRSGVGFTLADDLSQGAVNVVVQLGPLGDALCMRCSAPVTKDDEKQFLGKDCAAAECDAEPSPCLPVATTTTTTSTTTTTMPLLPATVLKALLPAVNGEFNYKVTPGLAGAELECEETVPGSHVCTVTDLLAAEAAGDLDNIKDPVSNALVTSFWAIDPAEPALQQCNSTTVGGTRWFYNTAHIDSGGNVFPLTNATGDLGALDEHGGGTGSRNCSQVRWIGCCQ